MDLGSWVCVVYFEKKGKEREKEKEEKREVKEREG